MRRPQSPDDGLGDRRLHGPEGLHLRTDPVLLLQLRVDSGVLQPGVSRFGYKSRPTINSLFSSSHREDHISTSSNAPTTLTTSTTTTTETYEEHNGIQQIPDNILSRSADPEAEAVASTPGQADDSPAATTEQQQQYFQETQTAVVDQQQQQQQQVSTDAPLTAATADVVSYTTTLPTLIQMHNQQQQQQQEEPEQVEDRPQNAEQQQRAPSQPEADQLQAKTNAFAFESLEKAFATAVPHKIRATKDLEQRPLNDDSDQPQLPWSWAKDIMLQKPVLKKSSQEEA
ncbi:probable serine/threonine-protein kinase mps1 isoform X2 [Adelges cooleyi]|uniref:probable serine/threonine-protein kinase mps1 isoform X2 n=1 Tax=Adelges cooleyi TaxID=133065 RepID=UPI00217FE7D1|nr:probable serine/threonine-protein kinase mps1 isoform X2 [Adelges cooleyi]